MAKLKIKDARIETTFIYAFVLSVWNMECVWNEMSMKIEIKDTKTQHHNRNTHTQCQLNHNE